MKILIGTPLRNRYDFIDKYFKSIFDINYPKKNIMLYFIMNDCEQQMVTNVANNLSLLNNLKHYNNILYTILNLENPQDSRTDIRHKCTYNTLAYLRNRIIEKAIGLCADYLLMIDSDILVKQEILNSLLAERKDIISATISNDRGAGKIFNVMRFDENNNFKHFIPEQDVFECDLTGACILINARVLRSGVRYSWHNIGEDGGFALAAKEKRFKMFSKQGLAEHFML